MNVLQIWYTCACVNDYVKEVTTIANHFTPINKAVSIAKHKHTNRLSIINQTNKTCQ